ncbi:zinc finger protein 62 homolog [Lingula anatina]|uniref:Zinc finger protein 62 homolog n=1 Tax=Lingula anatina TaxID=7574 RepID=A0A1S3I4V3_LINAN|nr:zinc finger protein 62 homolog [Lingula anatina]XP_013393254.2 zinc finger protein 62 homolog [Lingula anatina]|eukprot:XP_013393253.2 zinc finger protein 62 homolog [Lingula anatina]
MDHPDEQEVESDENTNQNLEETGNLVEDVTDISVATDELKCGRCLKVFRDILTFLEHKSDYLSSSSRYHCELCTQKFTRHFTLVQHYKKQHKISRFYHRGEGTKKAANKEATRNEGNNRTELKQAGHEFDMVPNADSDNTETGGNAGQDNTNIGGSTDQDKIVTEGGQEGEENSKTIHVQIVVQDSCETEHDSAPAEGSQVENQDMDTDTDCDFNFILSYQKLKGYTDEYSKMFLKCLHCQYKTVSKSALVKHFMGNHREALEINQKVDRDILDGTDREKIISLRVFNESYDSLTKTVKSKRRNRNIEKQDLPGIFPCDQCEKVFGRLRYLRNHLKTHRTERSFVCDQCGKGFTTLTYLNTHKRVHRERIFKCNQCDFTSKVNAAIHAHRQFHSQGSVLCDICGYAYTDKPTLAKHKRVHDLNRPFACTFPGCTWRFNTDVMCKAHIRAHTSDGKFRCRFCGYVFRHKHHLQRHESRMHGVNHDSQKQHQRSQDIMAVTEVIDTQEEVTSSQPMNLIINTDGDHLPLQTQQFVVTADSQGAPITYVGSDSQGAAITYEAADLYQALLQSTTETHSGEHTKTIFVPSSEGVTRTILVPQSEGNQIVFQQE